MGTAYIMHPDIPKPAVKITDRHKNLSLNKDAGSYSDYTQIWFTDDKIGLSGAGVSRKDKWMTFHLARRGGF